MEKVLQILVVLILLMLAINYYIKAEKTKFRLYRAAGRAQAPTDLLWLQQGMDPDNRLLFRAGSSVTDGDNAITPSREFPTGMGPEVDEGRVEVLDADTGEVVTHLTVGASPGSQVFDSETRILYSANGDGTLSIFRQVNRETYKLLQTLMTRPECRQMSLDARTKKIYLSMKGFLPETAGSGLVKEAGLSPTIAEAIECWVFSNG